MHQARPFVTALAASLISFVPVALGHGEDGHGEPKAV